jgi:hypothetical protein
VPRKIVYWTSTGIVCLALLGSLTYLTGSAEVVAGFAKAGYPQQLRIVLGIAKPVAAIVLLLPGFALLKGVGVRGRYVRPGDGDHLRLLVRRWRESMESAVGDPGARGGLLLHKASKPANCSECVWRSWPVRALLLISVVG